jgi:hypothetical protein
MLSSVQIKQESFDLGSSWNEPYYVDPEHATVALEEIEAIFDDYKLVIENKSGNFRSIVPMGIYDKSFEFPIEYFKHLGYCAFQTKDSRIRLILDMIQPESPEKFGACLHEWFAKICDKAMSCETVFEKQFFDEVLLAHPDSEFNSVIAACMEVERAPDYLGCVDINIKDASIDSDSMVRNAVKRELSPPPAPSEMDDTSPVQRRKRVKYANEPNLTIYINPKGVYPTRHGYRVQLNMKPNVKTHIKAPVKFSRNCKSYDAAMWLYEIIILISDCPLHLYQLLHIGNYDAMVTSKFIQETNVMEPAAMIYYTLLRYHMDELHVTNVLTNQEYNTACMVYDIMDTVYTPPGLQTMNHVPSLYLTAAGK